MPCLTIGSAYLPIGKHFRYFLDVGLYQQSNILIMEKPLLLRQYEYEIPTSRVMLPAVTKEGNNNDTENQPLLKVFFDFKNGHLKIEADWQYMVFASKYSEEAWIGYHENRVSIDASIYPALSINLNDSTCDGLVLPLEGYIEDGAILSSCSGLLALDKISASYEPHWKITTYLCDLQFDNCELNVQFPVYV
ncbi:hypothetical protein SY85_03380 [Flavisolibacter tropicus]|uniref:Uncharacterized protein n=2 Tax=Flavisolibacter tropicus TaxID=1492898 RepID=A0A172TRR8_9BACT|nr:hypothetical protein SY85_03380 [Flavisolibacter tropicus]